MILPNQQELFKAFSGFLIEAGLSAVSVKNYVSDLRHFLSFCNTLSTTHSSYPDEIVQNISKYVTLYTDNQKRNYTPQNTINRRLASIRRFKTFTDSHYGSSPIFTNISVKNGNIIGLPETHHTTSPLPSPSTLDNSGLNNFDHLKNVDKVLEQFRAYLSKDKKTHSTIKNYVSDINHFLSWSAKETPFSAQTLENLLTETQLSAYITYLKLNHTSTSVVNRRQSSIKKLAKFSYVSGFIPKNPFEIKITTPDLAPLSWFNRLSKPIKPQNASKNRFAIIYRKYNALPFTPYLHLGILALATAAMAIFGYNQIIKSALPSSAATALTPPKRQLSFQGRLTDSTGTPITTAVNVNFKLFNVLTGGSALYSTGTCSVTPDLSGVFNTLIGDGVCGAEITGSVFTDNRDVYLEVGVAAETLTPRQQIATVGYALNSETLQGYPASAAATINTVPVIDNSGNINIAAASPSINSTSGTFTINAQALTLKTAANSGGDIVLQPDSLNQGQILAIGGTTSEDTLRITNANLTTGALISGYVGSNAYTGRLLSLTSGSTEADRFYVGTNGQTMINTVASLANAALIVNQVGTGDLFTASSSGTNRFVVKNDGKVGIGITNPSYLLEVNGTARIDGALTLGDAAGDTVTSTAGVWSFTNPTTVALNNAVNSLNFDSNTLTIDALNNRVGIGITNPGYALDVNGSVNISGQYLINGTPFTSSNWQRTLGSLAPANITDSVNLGAIATNSATVHLAGTAGENSFINTGNFGIGTTSPTALLNLNADQAATIKISQSNILNPSNAGGIEFIEGAPNMTFGVNTYGFKILHDGSSNLLRFQYAAGGAASDLLTLARNNSSVGIGTTTPTAKLDIAGDASTSGSLVFRGSNPSTIDVLNGNRLDFQTSVGGDTGLSAKMTLSSDGNLGIGTTNPASFKLQVAGHVGPETTNTYDLGSAALQWRNIYGQTLYQNNTAINNLYVQLQAATPGTPQTGNLNISGTGIFGGDLAVGGTATVSGQFLTVNGVLTLNSGVSAGGTLGVSGQLLSSTGTGVQWIDAPTGSTGGPWTWTAGVIYPNTISDSVNLGNAATNSATVHLPGLINNDAFFNLGTGNFGIGLTNPAYTLDVNGDVNITGDYYVNGVLFSSSNWQRTADSLAPKIITDSINIGSTATNSAVVHLAGTAGDSSFIGSGDFGIGLTNPTNTLYLSRAGSAGITIDADTDNVTETDIPTLSFKADGGTERLLIGVEGTAGTTFTGSIADTSFIESAAATLGLQFATNNTARMTIEESGDVGIGNTTPGYNLDVTGTINASSIYRLGSQLLAQYDTAELEIGSHAAGNTLAFWSGGAQRITVDASGNVGIGATPGSFKLTVAGHTGPETTNSYDLGSAALQWRNIYGQTIYQNGTAIDNLFVKLQASTPGTQQTGNLNISGAGIFGGSLSANGNVTLGDAVGDTVTSNAGAWTFTNATTIALNNAVNSLNFDSNTLSIDALNDRIGIGTSAPGATFQVGTGTGFQVNSSGAVVAATGITSSGTITFSGLGTGIVHANSSGVLSSSAVNLGSADVTGVLALANGGTNNDNIVSPYVSGKFLAYDGTRLVSSAYDQTTFEAPLTFNNGLTRTLNTVALGGTLLADTTVNQDTFDMVFNGTGDFGIGVASPSQKLDVGGIFVVDTVNTRVGIGTTTPAAKLDIAGAASIISNDSGDITLNAASGLFNLSGDSITNVLNATFSGQVKLGAFADAGRPTPIGAGSLIYSTTTNAPQFYDGSVWRSLTNFFSRDTAGIIYPTTWYDSINLGSTTGASASAIIRLSTNDTFNTFFKNPIAVGYSGNIDNPTAGYTGLEVFGSIVPRNTSGADNLGHSSRAWGRLYLFNGINDTSGTEVVSISSRRLTGGDWNATNGLRVGSVGTVPVGYKLFVDGNATTSGGLDVYANLSVGGNAVIGGGTGKIDVGTVDPPYTIDGEKYATYMAGMIGLKEEVVGKVLAQNSTYIENVGYRTLIDLDDQDKITSNDLWLFGKTTNIKENISELSVLLTAEGQGKTWYQVDEANKILAIYSSTPSDVTYRLTAPRFDSYKWTNIRTSASAGHIITDVTPGQNIDGTGLLAPITNNVSMIAQIDGTYSLTINGSENFEISSIYKSLIANLTAGTAAVTELVADNLTVRTKLISPIAEIDDLKTINATVSGTLYADNIKGTTVDNLTGQLDLLSEKYATASAILADLQAKYTNYSTLLGATSVATISGDPLALSPLATTSATFPSDLALESLNVHTLIANDIMANGSLFTNSLSSFDATLFIQPLRNQPVNLMANLLILYPDGKIAVNGDLLISGTLFANAIDTKTATVSGTLALGKGTLASDSAALISLFGDNGQVVGSVDASGSANFNSLATSGLIIAANSDNVAATSSATINSNATIGIAKIATGASEIVISNNKINDSTLVYITPISDTSNQVLYVKSKTSGTGFTVAVPAPVANEVSFNYWLVQTK